MSTSTSKALIVDGYRVNLTAVVGGPAGRRRSPPSPRLVFSPFIVDATVTLVRRIAAGERIWEAHKSHFYQRLVQLGWGHRRTVLWEYVLMLTCGASAIVASAATPTVQWVIVILWAGVYGALIRVVGRLEKGFSSPSNARRAP